MWPRILVVGMVAFKIMYSLVNASSSNSEEVQSLPYCPNTNGTGAVIVSTLDGKLSVINSSGLLSWEIETGPGPLLVSNIHKLELTNNGEWIRIIPSLTGTLYKFDGSTIDPISISAETLLRSSFRYSDDLVIAGGLEVRTYGVGFQTGKLLYECTQSKCSNHERTDMDDVMVIERSTQTIRAVEPRTGHERWNFSVGLHDIKLPQVSCINKKTFNPNISAVIPEGLLSVSSVKNNLEKYSWQYKFHSPIVRVWKWDGMHLDEINLFEPRNMPGLLAPTDVLPSIYIGMHKRQLYIHESFQMKNLLQDRQNTEIAPAESNSVAKIPWKPFAASSESSEDDSTALSVLNNSEYVNGNGYYLYSEQALEDKNTAHCEKNGSKIIDTLAPEEEVVYYTFFSYLSSVARYYKEFLLIVSTVLMTYLIRSLNKHSKSQEIIIVEKPIEANIIRPERQISEKSSEEFKSRFKDDFKLIRCLGKGGFGIVFQVKQKFDDCDYAVKRITLPNDEKSQARVMREVKALAKLEHKNIIRYYGSWVEYPPFGWEEEHDKNWIESSYSEILTSTGTTTSPHKRPKSFSVSIDIPLRKVDDPSFDTSSDDCSDNSLGNQNNNKSTAKDDDSFIVFANDTFDSTQKDFSREDEPNFQFVGNKTVVVSDTLHASDHIKKKIDWKRPERKHHSWDLSSNNSAAFFPQEAPKYLYIQMQLCQKESLKEWLNLNKERNYNEMLNIFLQILDAVEYVHLNKLIHRDLKPSNIFFSLDGQIKVGDFGLVKDIESCFELDFSKRNSVHSYRGHTKEVGTTLYMSPEQSKGRLYDYRVDIYSLGIILFELLVPFSTDMERIKILTDIKNHKFPHGFADKYPAECLLVQRMLDDDPEKRLTTTEIRSCKPFAQSSKTGAYDHHL